MPLDPRVAKVLESTPPAPEEDELPLAEALSRSRKRVIAPHGVDNPVPMQDRMIPGPETDIPVRIYTPPGEGPFGLVMNFHGGGWVAGGLDQDDLLCQLVAKRGFVVVSVDYRLAPEAKFPGPFDDCYAAARWAQANAAKLKARGDRMAVMGSSAGGNLSAALAQKARDTGQLPVACQILICPILDHGMDTESYRANATGYRLTKRRMVFFWNLYVPNSDERDHPYASPLRAKSLAGLPPALIITAEYDPLRDEGETYGARLREAGVDAQVHRFNGLIHGYLRLVPGAPWVEETGRMVTELLTKHLGAR